MRVFGLWKENEYPEENHAGTWRTCGFQIESSQPAASLNPEDSCCETFHVSIIFTPYAV